MIDLFPNTTIFVQWAIFFVVFVALTTLVFKPTLKILENRKFLTRDTVEQSGKLRGQTEEILEYCEIELGKARNEAQQYRESCLSKLKKINHEKLNTARNEVEKQLQRIRLQIEFEGKEAKLQLKQYAQEASKIVAAKLLGRAL